MRIAGGYIRDKLLCVQSHDIDIAVNNMTGSAFVKVLEAYCKKNNIPFSTGYTVEARPEQSKHLETASAKIYGLEVEFTNLRKETYSDSRIPTMEFGTPEEDSSRRDLTINSMFFNIRTEMIEDPTGLGLQDLKDLVARTPCDPVKTFLDDPLRILRTIRFAAKYNLSIAPELKQAAKDKEVQDSFVNKISKERVWAELIGVAEPHGFKPGALTGSNPVKALSLICQFGFLDLLFSPKDIPLNSWHTDQNNKYHDLPIWGHTFLAFKHLIERMPWPDDYNERAIRALTIILHDLGKRDPAYIQVLEDGYFGYRGHDDRSAELADVVLTQLSAPVNIKERVVKLCKEHQRFLHISQGKSTDRAFRRILKDLGEDWENLCDVSEADGYGKKFKWDLTEVKEFFDSCRSRIKILLEDQGSLTIKRPISGKDLIAIGIKPGKIMGELLGKLDEALLDDPQMSAEDAMSLIKQMLPISVDLTSQIQ